jgi:hypothetical protein
MLCFPEEQKIKTVKGHKSIKDIRIGDEVLTDKRRFKKVTKLYKRKTSERMIEVIPYYEDRFTCTSNHPILTKNGWKQAGDLTKDDWIVKNKIKGKNYKCKETYKLRWSKNQKYTKENDDKYYIKLKRVNKEIDMGEIDVYNIEVEDDHTYEIEQCIVHNCGIPTIAPNHSGHLDYMNEKNSYLIDVDDWSHIGYRKDNLYQDILATQLEWKVPIIEDVRKKMRQCYEEYKDLTREEVIKTPMVKESQKIRKIVDPEYVGGQLKNALTWYETNYR